MFDRFSRFSMLTVFLGLAALFLAAIAPSSRPRTQPSTRTTSRNFPTPLIIGHRGAPGNLPEHTMASYRFAIQQGANFIEPDLVSTKDGVLIVRHENEMSRTTDVATKYPKRKRTKTIDGRRFTGWFSEDFTYAEIKTLRARERLSFRNKQHDGKYSIPSFDEVLALVQRHNRTHTTHIGVYPELKHSTYFQKQGLALEPKLLAALRKYKLDHKDAPVYVQSFEVGNLQRLRTQTKVKLIQLLYVPSVQPYDFKARGDRRTYSDLMTPKGLRFVATYADGIGPWKRLLLKKGKPGQSQASSLLQDAHKAGLLVHAYTFRNEARFLSSQFRQSAVREYLFFYRMGLDGVFSDFPGTAFQARRLFWQKERAKKP